MQSLAEHSELSESIFTLLCYILVGGVLFFGISIASFLYLDYFKVPLLKKFGTTTKGSIIKSTSRSGEALEVDYFLKYKYNVGIFYFSGKKNLTFDIRGMHNFDSTPNEATDNLKVGKPIYVTYLKFLPLYNIAQEVLPIKRYEHELKMAKGVEEWRNSINTNS